MNKRRALGNAPGQRLDLFHRNFQFAGINARHAFAADFIGAMTAQSCALVTLAQPLEQLVRHLNYQRPVSEPLAQMI